MRAIEGGSDTQELEEATLEGDAAWEWDIGKRLADVLYCWTFFGLVVYAVEKMT